MCNDMVLIYVFLCTTMYSVQASTEANNYTSIVSTTINNKISTVVDLRDIDEWLAWEPCTDTGCIMKRKNACMNEDVPALACRGKFIEEQTVGCIKCIREIWLKESQTECEQHGCKKSTYTITSACEGGANQQDCKRIQTKFCDPKDICNGAWSVWSSTSPTCAAQCNGGSRQHHRTCMQNGEVSGTCADAETNVVQPSSMVGLKSEVCPVIGCTTTADNKVLTTASGQKTTGQKTTVTSSTGGNTVVTGADATTLNGTTFVTSGTTGLNIQNRNFQQATNQQLTTASVKLEATLDLFHTPTRFQYNAVLILSVIMGALIVITMSLCVYCKKQTPKKKRPKIDVIGLAAHSGFSTGGALVHQNDSLEENDVIKQLLNSGQLSEYKTAMPGARESLMELEDLQSHQIRESNQKENVEYNREQQESCEELNKKDEEQINDDEKDKTQSTVSPCKVTQKSLKNKPIIAPIAELDEEQSNFRKYRTGSLQVGSASCDNIVNVQMLSLNEHRRASMPKLAPKKPPRKSLKLNQHNSLALSKSNPNISIDATGKVVKPPLITLVQNIEQTARSIQSSPKAEHPHKLLSTTPGTAHRSHSPKILSLIVPQTIITSCTPTFVPRKNKLTASKSNPCIAERSTEKLVKERPVSTILGTTVYSELEVVTECKKQKTKLKKQNVECETPPKRHSYNFDATSVRQKSIPDRPKSDYI